MSFQRKTISLAGVNRSLGEEIPLAATGGIFFDRVDGVGLAVRFNEDRTLIPIRAGRVLRLCFDRLFLVHGPGFAGEVGFYTFERGEDLQDFAPLYELSARAYAYGGAHMSTTTGGRYGVARLDNPADSGALLRVLSIDTVGSVTRRGQLFSAPLPLEPVGTITVSAKYLDGRRYAEVPRGVVVAGQTLAAGSTPLDFEGGQPNIIPAQAPGTPKVLFDRVEDGGGLIIPVGWSLAISGEAAGSPINQLRIMWEELAAA